MKTVQVLRRLVPEAWGGIETVVVATANALQQQGVRSRVLCTSALSQPGRESVLGLDVERFPYAYLRVPPRPSLRAKLDLKGGNPVVPALFTALLREPDVDVFVSHTMGRMAGMVRRAARLRGKPYVVQIHGGHLDVSDEEQADFRKLFSGTVDAARLFDPLFGSKRILEDASAVICFGETERQALAEQLGERRVHRIPHGVDISRFSQVDDGDVLRFRSSLGLDPSDELVVNVARIDRQKGQHILVKSVGRLRARGRPVHLLLVGHPTRPDYLEELRRTATASGLGEGLHIIEGLRYDDPRLIQAYRAGDVFALPSLHEPFGVVVLEAWAARRPVVASRVGGIPSFADHERNALLVPPGQERELAEALACVLDDEAMARGLAEAGHRKASESFDWQAIATRLKDIYKGL